MLVLLLPRRPQVRAVLGRPGRSAPPPPLQVPLRERGVRVRRHPLHAAAGQGHPLADRSLNGPASRRARTRDSVRWRGAAGRDTTLFGLACRPHAPASATQRRPRRRHRLVTSSIGEVDQSVSRHAGRTMRCWLPIVAGFGCLIVALWTTAAISLLLLFAAFGLILDAAAALFARAGDLTQHRQCWSSSRSGPRP
jgi:hypothetical protein